MTLVLALSRPMVRSLALCMRSALSDKIRIVCDRKTRVPDLLRIKETRGQELGEDVYSVVFLGQRFILIESMEMVLERAGVGNKFVKDC